MVGLLIDSERIYSIVTSTSFGFLLIIRADMYERLSIDEILSKYGKEMTWDVKAGCMGKRKL